MTYRYKTRPFPHQRKAFSETALLAAYGLLWEQGCVDALTEYLSPEGWRPIAQWAGEPIAQWNPITKESEFVIPLEHVALPYEGPMLRIFGQRIPEQLVSPEHCIPVMMKHRYAFGSGVTATQLAEELDNCQSRQLPAKWSMPRGGQGIDLSEADLRLQIAVMADGSFPSNCTTKRVVVRLKKQRKLDRLRSMLSGRTDVYDRACKPDGFFAFSFVAPLREKRFPSSWWQATPAQRRMVLDEIVHWDGSKKAGGRGWAYCSRHESDVDLIQFYAAAEGHITHKRFSSGVWEVNVRGISQVNTCYTIRKQNVEWAGAPQGNTKYCFSVPTGYWIARRKGFVYPTGNCGKTKPLIDTATYLFQQGKIRGLVIVAPNGVHRNWISDEIPAHMPDDVRQQIKYLVWDSKKADQVGFQKQMKALMRHEDGLAVVLVCYEASIRDKCKNFLRKFLDSRSCMMVLDESHKIKNADSKVKTTLVALGGHATARRIASGTPIEKPFDIYPQIRFLDPTFWKRKGFQTYEDFKQHFGIFTERSFGPRTFSQLVGHKNLEELGEMIKEIGWRLTKEDAGLNLPPKIYSKRYTELTTEQRRVYNELEDSFRTVLKSGELLEATVSMTRMLRLQQIACGYVSCEAEQPAQRVDDKNPRMDLACDEILDSLSHQAIIWHRFKADIDEMCLRLGKRCVRYDGQVGEEERAHNKLRFQKGDAQFFVASKAASTGHTLVGAKTAVCYSNSFSYIDRVQSEDRIHRIGQDVSVNYIDIIAADTIDEYIVEALRKKQDVVTTVLQDSIRPWI